MDQPTGDADAILLDAGLNLFAVFDIAALPAALVRALAPFEPARYRQLILIGHGGRALWTALQNAFPANDSPDPVDDFSVAVAERWFRARCHGHTCLRIYPGTATVPLQALGRLAGWHHDSPLGLGINARWGLWFAYRVALLADTELPATAAWPEPSPCESCTDKPCVASCPAEALAGGTFAFNRCAPFRLTTMSPCRETCLARVACPIGAPHRYDKEQLRHHYGASLAMIAHLR